MLVLTREVSERIRIGDNIIVTVLDIKGTKVRLGIDAPRDVPVHRDEVDEAVQAQKPVEERQPLPPRLPRFRRPRR